ncbi:hypothetical protein [Sphingorhabdus sp.]|uniref:hypothetical protein n=1 Tax=Sphingorhabdus sp. TaxID=1902408 RepID=UPI003D81B42B
MTGPLNPPSRRQNGKDIPADMRAAFPKTRGRPKGENKGGGDPDHVPAFLKD